ncbi:MAG: tetratricopeptide repeat protein [Alkalispirochaeta sp.]
MIVLIFMVLGSGYLSAQSTITVEAEDAVSTNFAADAVLLFGTGNNRTLQLNERSLLGDTPFYAEYAVYAPDAGDYELWYGGSIPGSRDTLIPSYGSPLVLRINDDPEVELFWEDVQVGPIYSTPYRWVRASTVSLQEGLNQVRIEVRERRRFDGRFFLYLDQLVFRPAEGNGDGDGDDESGADEAESYSAEQLPPDSELSDEPESIEDVLITVRDNPDDIAAWIRLADLYTLVGDHINALRYLNRAAVVEDQNPEILRRTARNLMWRGDLEGALDAYWQLLSADVGQVESFLEAGKIAAWNGFYGAGEQYYLAGLENFPENMQIRINLGFTYLWSGQEERARELFQRTESSADTPDEARTIAREYRMNDAAERAAEYLNRATDTFGGDEDLYADRYDLLLAIGDTAAAEQLVEESVQAVSDPEGLRARLQRIDRTYQLREQLIADFETAAAADPLDPAPRRTLAQTYLWTGRLEAGIDQFELLLAVESLRGIRGHWSRGADQIERAALVALVERDLRGELGRLTSAGSALRGHLSDIDAFDDDTPEEERSQVLTAARETAALITELSDRIAELTSFVEPEAVEDNDDLEELVQEAESAWRAVQENSDWSLALPRILNELRRGQGEIPGIDAHAAITSWILAEDRPVPPTNLIIGTADDVERLLLAWAWAGSGEAEVLQRVLEELPAEAGQILLYQELFGEPGDRTPAESAGAPGDDEPLESVVETGEELLTRVNEVQQETSTALQLLRSERQTRADIIQLESRVAHFELQNETVALRTQLGDYYVDNGDVERAIVQFETVQEVDPDNPDTLFALANAYQQEGRWARAMDAYAHIYRQDPNYRNVANLHNRLARENADQFVGGMRSVSEPTRVVFGSQFGYTYRFNSRLSVRATLDTAATRLRVNDDGITRRQYFEQGLYSVSAPVSFARGRWVVEPLIGVDVAGNQLFFANYTGQSIANLADSDEDSDGADYFQNWQIEPVLGISAQLSAGDTFASLSYRFGPYRPAADLPVETAFVSRPEFVSHSVNGTLSSRPAERPSPFWSRLRTETSGAADFISGGGSSGERVAAQQNLGFVLYSQSQPHTRLLSGLSVGYEDYFGDDTSVDYQVFYRPDEVLQVGGYVSGELYRSSGRDATVGVTGRVYGGLYQTQLFDDARPDPFELESAFRGAADLTAEVTRRAVAFQLGTAVSRVWDGATESEDFYSVGVSLNVIVTNPSLLAQ